MCKSSDNIEQAINQSSDSNQPARVNDLNNTFLGVARDQQQQQQQQHQQNHPDLNQNQNAISRSQRRPRIIIESFTEINSILHELEDYVEEEENEGDANNIVSSSPSQERIGEHFNELDFISLVFSPRNQIPASERVPFEEGNPQAEFTSQHEGEGNTSRRSSMSSVLSGLRRRSSLL